MSSSRSSGLKKAGSELMFLGGSAKILSPSLRFVREEGFFSLNSSSWAPGGATLLNVGFGMYSLMVFFRAILVRPLTCTYLTSPEWLCGRYLVKASVVSYMWLSASKTGKSSLRDKAASQRVVTDRGLDSRGKQKP